MYFRLSLLICLLFPAILTAQDKKPIVETRSSGEDNIFTKVEMEGGPNKAKFAAYLAKHSVIPASEARDITPGTYRVNLQYVIDIHGYIGQVEIKSDPGYGLGQRAIRILKNYTGEWTPASQCGRSVKSYRKETVTFIVSE
ncbi:MAG: hypothetical protein H7Y31_09680 [Chitinophagaceae bacterium]|nr:hypothetical protein [Chitinophagaceae bacterium]